MAQIDRAGPAGVDFAIWCIAPPRRCQLLRRGVEHRLAPEPLAVITRPPLDQFTVVYLRRMAQAIGLTQVGGVWTSKAKRADLLLALKHGLLPYTTGETSFRLW
ncbi:hypothetical protein [Synechococcus sp. 1G10]|uniref:hypothetical protein n=1 Tax=Synechococcus sp. 1G10 TaxID=2025605 RepID=UPI00117F2828|nr:hypothetical protein [Synechococcus sp. 1G10]